ncbi:cytochrome c-type biogenesis protein [Roseomonas sp. BN140053]|uniref:cytochrome c-type biogenesis protein n=1 Tax=Roseomonas sp. BN140053 TaxID=3391898 RepID=UPI0039E783FD
MVAGAPQTPEKRRGSGGVHSPGLRNLAFGALLALLAAGPALAVSSPDELLPDPAQEERARGIGRDLRCMVCQNQSIEDSDADLAKQLRGIVREQIAAGRSDTEVRDFVHARYGDFVLLRPPFNAATALLWATPVLVLLLAGGTVLLLRRRRPAELPALTEAERATLAALDGPGDGTPGGAAR